MCGVLFLCALTAVRKKGPDAGESNASGYGAVAAKAGLYLTTMYHRMVAVASNCSVRSLFYLT